MPHGTCCDYRHISSTVCLVLRGHISSPPREHALLIDAIWWRAPALRWWGTTRVEGCALQQPLAHPVTCEFQKPKLRRFFLLAPCSPFGGEHASPIRRCLHLVDRWRQPQPPAGDRPFCLFLTTSDDHHKLSHSAIEFAEHACTDAQHIGNPLFFPRIPLLVFH